MQQESLNQQCSTAYSDDEIISHNLIVQFGVILLRQVGSNYQLNDIHQRYNTISNKSMQLKSLEFNSSMNQMNYLSGRI